MIEKEKKYNVCVLMSTYNGEKYLVEQIDSVLEQQGVEVNLLVRDDGSCDGTCKILQDYQEKGKLRWYQSGNLGPARSFMELLIKAPYSDFYAFCDQDDYWDNDKLEAAVVKLNKFSSEPALYISALRVVDENLQTIFVQKKEEFNFTFGECLFRNAATGCTMVLNNSLREYVLSYSPDFMTMHDSWIYQICNFIGGKIIFDKIPHISYRQHGNNVVGVRSGFKKIYSKINNWLDPATKGVRIRTCEELKKGYYSNFKYSTNHEFLDKVINYKSSFKNKIRLLADRRCNSKRIAVSIVVYMSILFNKV